jgi:hypothetical protein
VVSRITFFIVIFFTANLAVIGGEVADRVEKGEKYRQKHPNEDFVATSIITHIKFNEKKRKKGLASDNLVYSTSSTKVQLISLKDGFGFLDRIFYSEAVSSVDDIYFSLGKKKKLLPRITDNAYQDNNIFHHDIHFKKYSFYVSDLGQEASFSYAEKINNIKYLPRLFFHNCYKAEKKINDF